MGSGPSAPSAAGRQAAPVRHVDVLGDGVRLHVAVAGSGPPVVLLHGFPENWRSWQHQFPPLVEAGYSVWAPDLRGYNLSARPAGRAAYHLRHLVADLAAIVAATGAPRAIVGGHDWGGIVAWTFAGMFPALVDKLVVLNAPHMEMYARAVRHPEQLARSWYAAVFLLPGLPELALAAHDFAVVRRLFKRSPARAGAFSDEQIDEYVAALSPPGALTAALNYYRANAWSDGFEMARRSRIRSDTLVLWGDRDAALSPRVLEGLAEVAPKIRVRRFPDVGHWIQNEAPDEINREILSFLGRE